MKNLKKKKLFHFTLLHFFVFQIYAHAYVDPGTGSFILQAIITFFAAVIFYLGYPIRYIRQLYKKIFKKDEVKVKKDLDPNKKSE